MDDNTTGNAGDPISVPSGGHGLVRRSNTDDPSARRRSLSADLSGRSPRGSGTPRGSPRGRPRTSQDGHSVGTEYPNYYPMVHVRTMSPRSEARTQSAHPSVSTQTDRAALRSQGIDFNPPLSPSAFSQVSNPLSHQSSLNADAAAKLKKWVQNEEHLVPKYEVDEDEDLILDKGENELWGELFPEDDNFLSQLEQEDSRRQAERKVGWRGRMLRKRTWRFLKSKRFISWSIIGFIQINAVVLGICNLLYAPYQLVWDFQVWRICFLVALLPFTWIFGDFFVWLVIKFVEKFLFTFPNCLYFTYACKGPLRWVMRFLALTILWACMMTIHTEEQLDKINEVYDYILQAIGCITLFFTANLLKRLAAKSLALNLNKGKNQLKLEAALRKEKILRTLLGPRRKQTSFLKATIGGLSSMTTMTHGTMKKSWSSASGGYGLRSRSKSRSARKDDVEGGLGDSIDDSIDKEEVCIVDINDVHAGAKSEAAADGADDHANSHAADDDSVSLGSDSSERRERKQKERADKEELEQKRKLEKQKELQRRKNVILRLNLLETYIRNHNIKVAFKDELNTASIEKIESEGEAKRVGSFLYWNVKGELTGFIIKEDLEDFFLDAEEKDLAFSMLDISGDGKVDLRECIQAVDAVFVDRRNLAATLKDGKNITKTIENLIGIVIHVIFIFFYLLVWQADVGSIWVSFSGIILGFSFIFSRTVSEIFDNVVFLFGTHAYSVGDLLMITESQMVVEEISLNFTQLRDTNGRTVWMPNQFLVKNAFTNLTTSTNFFASFVIWVDWKTVSEKPDLLEKVVARLEAVKEEHRGEYGPGLRAVFDGFKEPYKVGIKVVFEYGHSGTDLRRTGIAKGWMVQGVGEVLVAEGVEYTDVIGRGGGMGGV